MGVAVRVFAKGECATHFVRWQAYLASRGPMPLSRHPDWLTVLQRGLQQTPYAIEAVVDDRVCGFLPLALINGWLFGRFLVSLPYLNYGGIMADSTEIARELVDSAIILADRLKVRFMELRHELAIEHERLVARPEGKVHMRMQLPATTDELWKGLSAKVRNQIRKGQKNKFTIAWGGKERLPQFYSIFSQNMRDLGTPVYGQSLFRAILEQFPDQAELAVVCAGQREVAAALLLHSQEITEVPSASSLRSEREANANMLMYWHLLERAVQRGQRIFDFGRSSPDSNTYRFKKQWDAKPHPSQWQYYLRQGSMDAMRPTNPEFGFAIRAWKKLPVWLTRLIGPWIVRGIP